MSKRHIRILAGHLDRRAGSSIYHHDLALRLAERGHRVSVVCFESQPEVASCCEVHAVPLPVGQPAVLWRLAALRQYRQSHRGLMRLPLERPDVVIGGEHLFLKAHAAKFPQCPWIYLPHALRTDLEITHANLPAAMRLVSQRVYGSLQKWALRNSSVTLRFSELGCAALRSYYPKATAKTRFVCNPIGIEIPQLKRPAEPIVPARLLSVGNLIPGKNIATAIRALGECRTLAWNYDVVGAGAELESLQRLAATLEIADRIAFHGFQASPQRYYQQASLLLFPSLSESLGLVCLEAMAHGCPVLAFRSDGQQYQTVNDEIIEHRVTGLLADDEESFILELQKVVADPELLIPLGQAARQRVATTNTWEKHLERYETLFTELLAVTDDSRSVVTP